jgi:hypothetical protein
LWLLAGLVALVEAAQQLAAVVALEVCKPLLD